MATTVPTGELPRYHYHLHPDLFPLRCPHNRHLPLLPSPPLDSRQPLSTRLSSPSATTSSLSSLLWKATSTINNLLFLSFLRPIRATAGSDTPTRSDPTSTPSISPLFYLDQSWHHLLLFLLPPPANAPISSTLITIQSTTFIPPPPAASNTSDPHSCSSPCLEQPVSVALPRPPPLPVDTTATLFLFFLLHQTGYLCLPLSSLTRVPTASSSSGIATHDRRHHLCLSLSLAISSTPLPLSLGCTSPTPPPLSPPGCSTRQQPPSLFTHFLSFCVWICGKYCDDDVVVVEMMVLLMVLLFLLMMMEM